MKLYSIVWRNEETDVVITSTGWLVQHDEDGLLICSDFSREGNEVRMYRPILIRESQLLEQVELTHNYKVTHVH